MIQRTQHPLSAAFPAMTISELSDLTMDIVNNGLRNPITLYEGMILDGWHRYRACSQIENGEDILRTVEFPEYLDPVAFVRSQNYHRRHLSAGQKAVAEVELSKWAPAHRPATQEKGDPGSPLPEPVATNQQMAAAAEVDERTIQRAKRVVEAGLGDAVKSGEVSVKRAAEVAKLPEPERQAALHAPPPPRPKPRGVAPVDLSGKVADLTEEIQELASLLQATEEDNKSMARVLEADDQLAQALVEAKRYRELARVVQERNNGLMNQNHALGQVAKRWMNKFLKLERTTKGENTTKEEDFTHLLAAPDRGADDDPGPSEPVGDDLNPMIA